MKSVKKDEEIEHRIEMEIVVDAYDEGERATGWQCYLQDNLAFPFKAKCVKIRRSSPLEKKEVVEVVEMAMEAECEHEMFVEIIWQGRKLIVPLSQLEGLDIDEETHQAIGDWHYWIARGYEF